MSILSVKQQDDGVRFTLEGPLDEDIGTQLVELTEIALSISPEVIIDVSAITGLTRGGLEALFECADLGARVPPGSPAAPSDP